MDRGRDEDALAHGPGQHEDGVRDVGAGRRVEQLVLAAAGLDGEGLCRRHVVDRVGVDAGGVDDAAGAEGAAVGRDGPGVAVAGERGHGRVEGELDAVGAGVLEKGDREAEGVADAGRGRPERGDGLVRDVWLHAEKLFSLDDAKALDAVLAAAFEEGLEAGAGVVGGADDERSDAHEGELEVAREVVEEGVTLDVEAGHERAGTRVEAGVDDGGVGLGGSAADVVGGLEHEEAALVAGKLAGRGAAAHARTDDDDVVDVVLHACSLVAGGWDGGRRCDQGSG